jgi:hypothetical protein
MEDVLTINPGYGNLVIQIFPVRSASAITILSRATASPISPESSIWRERRV